MLWFWSSKVCAEVVQVRLSQEPKIGILSFQLDRCLVAPPECQRWGNRVDLLNDIIKLYFSSLVSFNYLFRVNGLVLSRDNLISY